MPLPPFLGPAMRISMSALGGLSPLGGAGGGSSRKLTLSVAKQLQSNWCWAAVSSSVSVYYTAAGTWTQCLVANAALPRTDCCGAGASDRARCNKPWYLDTALTVTSNLAAMEHRALTFAEVQAEIANDAPIGTRVGWYGGGGHFQAIVGWLVGDTGIEYIDVSDPIYLDTQVLFADFASGYQTGGDWTHSYLTCPPSSSLGGEAVLADEMLQPASTLAIGA